MKKITAHVSVTMEVKIEGEKILRKGFFNKLPYDHGDIDGIDAITDDLLQILFYCSEYPEIYQTVYELVCNMLDTPPDQETDEPVGESMGE